MTDIRIRRAGSSDADGFGACLDAAYAPYARRIDGLPSMSEGCAEEIARNLVWVAEREGRILGGLVLSPREDFMALVNVAVHPDGRGTGIGRQLLQLADSEALSRGYAQMRLNSHADMRETIALYQRTGWVETARQGKTVTMKKDLVA